jgi:hypothetical protein
MENLVSIIAKPTEKYVHQETNNYMFFSNLKQMKRQCEILLKLNENAVNTVLNDGHDWADDHITVAKENIDQVFDFMVMPILAKVKSELLSEQYQINESKNCPNDPTKWAASKAAAKAKFDIYPSAYANGWAAKNYKSKGGTWKKCKD